jgi:peptide/nickel transport system substrate-binding protein
MTMKNLTRIILVGIVIAVLAALAIPVAAQDAEPGSGGPLILPNFGADPTTFNPFLSNDGTSSAIWTRMYPAFLATDPDIGYFVPGARGAIVADWSVSEDGLTYTFTLRDDYTWSDGTPITSADIAYAWEVIQDETVENGGNMIDLRDKVASIETPDATTVVVTFNDPNCNSLDLAAGIPVVPSHVWREQFPTNSDMNGADYNLEPEVTGGVYNFLNYRPGEQVTLVANPAYPDGYAGAVIPEGFIYKNVADQTVQSEQFLAGQLTYMGVPSARQQELLDLGKAGEYHYHESTRANTRFVALNLADRSNPLPGLDENGEIQDQGMHPVLGDVRVRQALNYAINYEELNSGAFNGFGIQGATHSRPDDWAYDPTITPYPFDQEQAMALLEEAGWTDSDGDGVRECNGCLYAEENPDYAGSPLTFQLLTNAGNTSQEALGTLLQDQWGEVGFDIDFQAIDFGVLVEQFTAQDFDAVMIFWGFGFPFDPDGIDATFGSGNDTPGEGFNAVSYNNPRLNEILDEARALPGCDIDERRTLYQEAYRILHEDSPWIWIGIGQTLAVAQPWVEGWAPKPTASNEALYNEDAWLITAP